MARVKEIDFGRGHAYQNAASSYARREFMHRRKSGEACGGIILADGVGLGKTYEALGATVSLLGQLQHNKERKKHNPFRLLVLVPPRLVTKWADELLLPDRFRKYLKTWSSAKYGSIRRTFENVAVVRNLRALKKRAGVRRYRSNVLFPGLYVINANVLRKRSKKVTQIRHTKWDVVIVDEAHHTTREIAQFVAKQRTKKTALLLLTATPFQLSPAELKRLLSATYNGWKDPKEAANKLYSNPLFREYRQDVGRYFNDGDSKSAAKAMAIRKPVEKLLRPRVVRNRKQHDRAYFVVDEKGTAHPLVVNPFGLNEGQLRSLLQTASLIRLADDAAAVYLFERNEIARAAARRNDRPFVSAALRQLLSSWHQYKSSAFGRHEKRRAEFRLPSFPHPKLEAVRGLTRSIFASEVQIGGRKEGIGKVLVFSTFVGASGLDAMPLEERVYGTAARLKHVLGGSVDELFPKPGEAERLRIFKRLWGVFGRYSVHLKKSELAHFKSSVKKFSGSRAAHFALEHESNLSRELRELKKLLDAVHEAAKMERSLKGGSDEDSVDVKERRRRLRERRIMLLKQVEDRYTTRDLVARYDGSMKPEERDRHLRGFNSPFAPFVLIASAVGQEGIDLQRFCRHVIHYDLEWNPAKLEQREGRVDRQGRRTDGPVKVYFLICRGTYDERMMHVMVNRFRWHQVLLADKRALENAPRSEETSSQPTLIRRIALDLAPRR